jgi:hypothetical protein
MRKAAYVLVVALSMAALVAASASAQAWPPPEGTLIAGQHYEAGQVEVWVEDDELHVLFQAADGWTLGETHLYVGTTLPKKSAPGRFPYKDEEYYVIPLEELEVGCDDQLFIAAHAVVYNEWGGEETAWAFGERFGKGWAMYFEYYVECDGEEPPES